MSQATHPDRVVFDRLVLVLVLDASYEKIADSACSATTIRDRRDGWITAGVFTDLEQSFLEAYDRIVGLELSDVCVDGCSSALTVTRAPGCYASSDKCLFCE